MKTPRLLAATIVLIAMVWAEPDQPVIGSAIEAAPNCEFRLGFRALHDLIPDTVGECVEEERHNPENGDALQQTTGGLLAWRKVDNFTAFTDGAMTWVNGPTGLERRRNDERFSWEVDVQPSTAQQEPNSPATPPPTASVPRAATPTVAPTPSQSAAGTASPPVDPRLTLELGRRPGFMARWNLDNTDCSWTPGAPSRSQCVELTSPMRTLLCGWMPAGGPSWNVACSNIADGHNQAYSCTVDLLADRAQWNCRVFAGQQWAGSLFWR